MSEQIQTTTDQEAPQADEQAKIRELSPQHLDILLTKSAITQDVIKERGYFTIASYKEAALLGFGHKQSIRIAPDSPALVIPYYSTAGLTEAYCMRPDYPRSFDDKDKGKLPDGTYPQKVLKYELPKGAGNVLDCHPRLLPHLKNPNKPVIFTEGAKKADSLISRGYLAINLNGIYGWRGTNHQQGRAALAAFDDIALNGRQAILLFDSDFRANDNVKGAIRRFKAFLEHRGAKVVLVLLPPSEEKMGVDDWFASGKTANDLNHLITYFEAFAPDLGQSQKDWTTETIRDWLLSAGLTFAINDMSETLTVNGEPVDDTFRAILRTQLRDEGIPLEHAEDTTVLMGNEARFHPIKDYLKSLTWDSKDWISALCTYLPDKDKALPIFLKRFLVGAVARAFESGTRNLALVLGGPEDIGKSSFARWLCPIDSLFCESKFDPDSNDTKLRMIEKWLWELGELGSITRRADRDALKHALTETHVTARRPYGHFDMRKSVPCSFIGTVNLNSPFLDKSDENTRFAVVSLEAIDFNYSRDIDINQVWAQAYALYLAGESWRLTQAEARRRSEINEDHRVEEPLKEMVLAYFTIIPDYVFKKGDKGYRSFTSDQILDYLGLDPSSVTLTQRLAEVLRGLGIKQSNPRKDEEGRGGRYWDGLEKNLDRGPRPKSTPKL